MVGGRFAAGCGRVGAHSWKKISSMVAEQRASLGVLSFSGFQVLIGDVDLSFQGIELRILKNLPPVAAEILIVRLRCFPITYLFIGWRNLRSGTLIIWSNGTSGKHKHAQHTDSACDALADSTFHSGGAHEIHC